MLHTTFFHNTSELFEVDIVEKKVRKVTQKKELDCESLYVIGGIDDRHCLIRRDSVYKNNQLVVFRRNADGTYIELPLEEKRDYGYQVWEETLKIGDVEAVFYGKNDSIPNDKRGLILYIHGGPHSIWVNNFNPLLQYFLHRGHNVLNVNYTGSPGRGQNFAKALHGQSTIVDVDDVKKFVELLKNTNRVDQKNIKVFTGSTGGMLALAYMLTYHDDLSHASIFNPPHDGIVQHFESVFMGTWPSAVAGMDTPLLRYDVDISDKELNRYRERACYNRAWAPKTEVLLFGGLKDSIVPPQSNRNFYKLARSKGAKLELFEYPDEEHIFITPTSTFDFMVKTAVLFSGNWKFV